MLLGSYYPPYGLEVCHMSAILKLIELLYPFIKEFGLKDVNIKEFISKNKSLSYLLLICALLFIMLLYALEQANMRLQYRLVLLDEIASLNQAAAENTKAIAILKATCISTPVVSSDKDGNVDYNIENSLSELMEQ